MHYYKFNIADYRKDTMHLSRLEHSIYRELIDTCYLDEKPIKTQQVIRRLRLVSEEEVLALQNVLNDFFEHEKEEDCWRHLRIEQEIAAFHKRSDNARANGAKGGRPKKPKKTQSVNSANQNKTKSKTNHKPLTINQELLVSSVQHIIDPVAIRKFMEYRKRMNKPIEELDSLNRLINKAKKISENLGMPIEQVFYETIDNGWQGFRQDYFENKGYGIHGQGNGKNGAKGDSIDFGSSFLSESDIAEAEQI